MRRAVVVAGVLAMMAAAGIWTLGQRVRLDTPVGALHSGAQDAVPGLTYTIGGIPLCLDRPGWVTVESVSFESSTGGIAIHAFGVRLRSNGPAGTGPGSLDRHGFDVADRVVVLRCPERRPDRETGRADRVVRPNDGVQVLGIEVSKSQAVTAEANSLVVRYRSALGAGRLVVPLFISM